MSSSEARRRERIAKACAQCRRKKIKCDGMATCLHCVTHKLECIYEKSKERRPRTKESDRMASRLLNLESMVAALVGKLEPLTGQLASASAPSNGSSPLEKWAKTGTTGQDSTADDVDDGEDYTASESGESTRTPSDDPRGSQNAKREDAPKTACTNGTSIFHEYQSFLDISQDAHQKSNSAVPKVITPSQFKGPQLGFSMLLSQQSIDYVKSKLPPQDHYLVVPMQTLPVYMLAAKKAFHSMWSEPRVQMAECIAKIRLGVFPEEEFIEEVISLFDKLHFANFICSGDDVRALFAIYYKNKAAPVPDPSALSYSELMIMTVVMMICTSAYVDIRNTNPQCDAQYPRVSKFTMAELVAFQESLFKKALFYYHRICSISEGLATIQALILMVVHLETSWVISDLNFSLVSMAVRFAQDMGLHRLDSATNIDDAEKDKRSRVWRACQNLDIEVCYRSGKPPSVNLLDVSLDNLFFHDCPAVSNAEFRQRGLCNEYNKLAYIRCYSYMRLFSAQVKYDSLQHIQEVVSAINADMFQLSESMHMESKPRFYNEPGFQELLLSLTSDSQNTAHFEMLMGFHLTYFNHILTINRVPWAVVPEESGTSAQQNVKFRKLALDSARTILHMIRIFEGSNSTTLSFNWLVAYPFMAITNLLSHCLNYPEDPEMLKDLSLLIDVSMNTFGKIGARAAQESSRLFYIRVRSTDIIIRVIMKVVITIVDRTRGTSILTSNPGLLEHLSMVETEYSRLYKPLATSIQYKQFSCESQPAKATTAEPIRDQPTMQNASPLNFNPSGSGSGSGSSSGPTSSASNSTTSVPQVPGYDFETQFTPGFSTLEVMDYLDFGNKFAEPPVNPDFVADPIADPFTNLPNFFFDNGR